jgi:hypothetical protein
MGSSKHILAVNWHLLAGHEVMQIVEGPLIIVIEKTTL